MYHRGHGVAQDFAEAAGLYGFAADQGSAPAQYALGLLFRGGLGVPRDDAEAVRWFRQAAEQGLARAKAFLAHMYYIGQGVARDYAAAARWYRGAAELGDVKSQVRLAKMYCDGKGVKRDCAEAAKWYRRAAEQGDTAAPFRLAVIYYNGDGVKRDDIQAHKWFAIAAARAETGGIRDQTRRNRDIVARRMNPAQIAEARRLARQWPPERPAATATPHRQDAGLTRQLIFRIQRGLASIGYDHGPADGFLGRKTRAAIRAFQSRAGLPSTGRITQREVIDLMIIND